MPKATLEAIPSFLPHKQINLGLDLRGGSYLLLQVDTATANKDRLQAQANDVRKALLENKIAYTGLGINGDAVTVRITKPEDVDKAVKALDGLGSMVAANQIGRASCRERVCQYV